MDRVLEYLGNKPIIGMVGSLSSSVISFLSQAGEVLKFAGITVGLIVGLLTAYKLLIQIKREKLELKQEEENG